MVEVGVAIICACLPTLRTLFDSSSHRRKRGLAYNRYEVGSDGHSSQAEVCDVQEIELTGDR